VFFNLLWPTRRGEEYKLAATEHCAGDRLLPMGTDQRWRRKACLAEGDIWAAGQVAWGGGVGGDG